MLEWQAPVLASSFSCIVWEGTACMIAQDLMSCMFEVYKVYKKRPSVKKCDC